VRKTRDTGARLNEFAEVNVSASGDCVVLSNMYPSDKETKPCEGIFEMPNKIIPFQRPPHLPPLIEHNEILNAEIVQKDGVDTWIVAAYATTEYTIDGRTVKGYAVEVSNMLTGVTNIQEIRWQSSQFGVPKFAKIDKCVYVQHGDEPYYIDFAGDEPIVRKAIRKAVRASVERVLPTWSGLTVAPNSTADPTYTNRAPFVYIPNNTYLGTATGAVGGARIAIQTTPREAVNLGFRLYDFETVVRNDESLEVLKQRNPFRVNYIFAYVRHTDKNNEKLFDQDGNAKKCDTFHIPEAHGLVAANNINDLEINALQSQAQENGIYSILFTQTNRMWSGTETSVWNAFAQPRFLINDINNEDVSVNDIESGHITHVRIYRSNEIDTGEITALTGAGMQGFICRFLTDIPLEIIQGTGGKYVRAQFMDGDEHLGFTNDDPPVPLPRTFINNTVLIGGEANTYNLFGAALIEPSHLIATLHNRVAILDKNRQVLMLSMTAGQDGNQGGAENPNMYRMLFAANNWIRINERILAVSEFSNRIIVFTRHKTYTIENANNINNDGTLRNAPIEISGHIGTIFPNGMTVHNEILYFIDSDGDVSQVRGSECIKSAIPISSFRTIAKGIEDDNDEIIMTIKAISWRDMVIFAFNHGRDVRNFRLYCQIDRPSENIKGLFTYDRYPDIGYPFGTTPFYGGLWYGDGWYGYGVGISGRQVAFANGNYLYAIGRNAKYRLDNELRVSRLFVDNQYEDYYYEETERS